MSEALRQRVAARFGRVSGKRQERHMRVFVCVWQIATSRVERAESISKRRERHKLYKEEQDSSGVPENGWPAGYGQGLWRRGADGEQAVMVVVGKDT